MQKPSPQPVPTEMLIASLSPVEIRGIFQSQAQTIDALEHQLEWFKRQMFGTKSERLAVLENTQQLPLAELTPSPESAAVKGAVDRGAYPSCSLNRVCRGRRSVSDHRIARAPQRAMTVRDCWDTHTAMQATTPKFEIRGDVLCALDAAGAVAHRHRPVGTRIVQFLLLGERLIVREDYYQFPRGISNLYCLDKHLRPIWSAELPAHSDIYANKVLPTEAGLVCASWEGLSCTIDPGTGRIAQRMLTK